MLAKWSSRNFFGHTTWFAKLSPHLSRQSKSRLALQWLKVVQVHWERTKRIHASNSIFSSRRSNLVAARDNGSIKRQQSIRGRNNRLVLLADRSRRTSEVQRVRVGKGRPRSQRQLSRVLSIGTHQGLTRWRGRRRRMPAILRDITTALLRCKGHFIRKFRIATNVTQVQLSRESLGRSLSGHTVIKFRRSAVRHRASARDTIIMVDRRHCMMGRIVVRRNWAASRLIVGHRTRHSTRNSTGRARLVSGVEWLLVLVTNDVRKVAHEADIIHFSHFSKALNCACSRRQLIEVDEGIARVRRWHGSVAIVALDSHIGHSSEGGENFLQKFFSDKQIQEWRRKRNMNLRPGFTRTRFSVGNVRRSPAHSERAKEDRCNTNNEMK